jgi:hypothetical protein
MTMIGNMVQLRKGLFCSLESRESNREFLAIQKKGQRPLDEDREHTTQLSGIDRRTSDSKEYGNRTPILSTL